MVDRGWLEEDRMKKSCNASRVRKLSSLCRHSSSSRHVYYQKTPSPIKDIIYVVEDSVNLAAYFDDLLSTYLVQALEHFNGGSHTTVERAWASVECSTTFTLVLVKSSDWRPGLITTFRGPFTSAKRFFNALENIQFVGMNRICKTDVHNHRC